MSIQTSGQKNVYKWNCYGFTVNWAHTPKMPQTSKSQKYYNFASCFCYTCFYTFLVSRGDSKTFGTTERTTNNEMKKQIDSWKDSNCLLVHELCECACTEFSIAIVMGWIDTERDWVHSIKRFYLIARLSTSCNNCLGMRMHCESHNKYEIV